MKHYLYFLLISLLSFNISALVLAQNITSKKCIICGKPFAQCAYKGKHPTKSNTRSREETSALKKHVVKLLQSEISPFSGLCNGHGYVDLGLPSGTKWATMNIDANSISDFGSYYAWGEIAAKKEYSRMNYKYYDSEKRIYTKYNTSKQSDKELDLSDDVAYVKWGKGWRLPNWRQIRELIENCIWTWSFLEGHYGYLVVGPNNNSVFLPAAGFSVSESTINTSGRYISSSRHAEFPGSAEELFFTESKFELRPMPDVTSGFSARAVYLPND